MPAINNSVFCRRAVKNDLPEVLRLYAQPGLDDGECLSLSANMKRAKAHAFYESLGFERHGYSFRSERGAGMIS